MNHTQFEGGDNTPDIVHSVFVQSKATLLVRAVDQVLDVLADVVGQLFKQHLRLVVGEWPHDGPNSYPLPPKPGSLFSGAPDRTALMALTYRSSTPGSSGAVCGHE